MRVHRVAALLVAVVASGSVALLLWSRGGARVETYAIEIDDVLCGHVELASSDDDVDGERITVVTHEVFTSVSLLGSEFDMAIDTRLHVDPATERVTYVDVCVEKGDRTEAVQVFVEGDRARFVYPLDDGQRTVMLPPDVVIENPAGSPHLVRDFVERGAVVATYPVLSVQEAEVQDTTYTRIGSETVELAGRPRETLVLDSRNEETGQTMRLWIEPATGRALKMTLPRGRLIYLADASIKDRLELANLDATIMTRANVVIPDVPSISFMRVRAILEPVGLRLRAEDLNVPGQRFDGRVEGNRVEGVFTIEHPLYDGSGAPPFPPDHGGDEALAAFLAPELTIEADDPVLVEQAREITAGAADSWDAACRLSRWVSDHLDYAIPGGGTARKAYDTRAGECGAHSNLLVAFCRAVGIPARVVWGCMYVPKLGGSFGQHGWTEVFMGEAGWIPVDATAREYDYVDSGHVRVGHVQNLASAINLVEMEVLDHRLRDRGASEPSPAVALEGFVGSYSHRSGQRSYEVRIVDGALTLMTPEQTVLSLRPPDGAGRWHAVMSGDVYCTFARNERGDVAALTLHQVLRMPRQETDVEIGQGVPEELRPYLGSYRLAALRANFEVRYQDDRLGVYYPTRRRVLSYAPTAEEGHFVDESGMHEISFSRDEEGSVTTLFLDAGDRFERQALDDEDEPVVPEVAAVEAMLRDFHDAAAAADAERYFAHLAPDAIIMGTASEERWTVAQLRSLIEPSFAAGSGFTTLPTEQHVSLAPSGDLAWFDERLRSTRWGEMRGSGVARKIDGRWQIVHYNRAFPIPNEMVPDLVTRIEELARTK